MKLGYIFQQSHLLVIGLIAGGWTMLPNPAGSYDVAASMPSGQVMTFVATPPPSATPSAPPSPSRPPAAGPPTPTRTIAKRNVALMRLAGRRLYVEPDSRAAGQAKAWRVSRSADAARMDRIATLPQARWLGDWTPQPTAQVANITTAAARAGAMPVFVAYNLPGRDCSGHSAGGAATAEAYRTWIGHVASGIGDRPATVILEPDATAEIDCFGASQRQEVLSLLAAAVKRLKANPATLVYLDAGNARWHPAATMAPRLAAAGLAAADGFSLNVSNFVTTEESVRYGNELSRLTSGKHYVVDTSRNGAGHNGTWCNPPDRALGQAPTTTTGAALADAYLWIKAPGESDGACNGGPRAGEWWAVYALGLAVRAGY